MMSKSLEKWLISDELWSRIEPLLPARKVHPLGCHRPRVNDRAAMNAIFFVLRTGCQWNALNVTGLCTSSSAHRRFQEWQKAGVFERLWHEVLEEYDDRVGLDWRWLSADGATTKAPLCGKKTGRNPTDRGKLGVKRSLLSEARGVPVALVIAGANRHDLPLLEHTLESIPPRLEVRRQRLLRRARAKGLTQSQNLCLDKGFDSAKAQRIAQEFGLCPHIRSRGEETLQKQ